MTRVDCTLASSTFLILVFCVIAVSASGAHAQEISPAIENGGFDAGLTGWDVFVLGPPGNAGSVTGIGGAALFEEQDAFLLQLDQEFVVPSTALEIAFDVLEAPGFDLNSSFIPDAFEAALIDDAGDSVVPTWSPSATTFFNLQEDGTVNLAPGVSFDGVRVRIALDPALEGQTVRLVFQLIGADLDQMSGVTIDNVELTVVCVEPSMLQSYGVGTAGTGGVPVLGLSADPVVGTNVQVLFDNVYGQSSTYCIVVGTAKAMVTFSGLTGTFLVDPLDPSTFMTEGFLPARGLALDAVIPADSSLCGTELYLQGLHYDPGAPSCYAFSSGLIVTFGS